MGADLRRFAVGDDVYALSTSTEDLMSKLSDFQGSPDAPAFIFVPELIELKEVGDLAAIGPHAQLQKAPDSHKAAIRNLLAPFVAARGFNGVNPWEFEEVPNGPGSTRFELILDPDKHQFWMVSHWRRVFDTQLELALELADPSVTPVISRLQAQVGSSGYVNGHAILNWLDENILARRRVIGPKQIAQIASAHDILISFECNDDPSIAFIHKALRDFSDLKRVSRRMPIYVVGLFSIIESLLTTNQTVTTEKSLNYQLQEKLTLISNRFGEKLDLASFFGAGSLPPYKTLIKKLYQYRSDVAHGNVVDFSKELQILENHQAVCEFLFTLVRRLLLQAVREPDLIRDLKGC